MCVTFYLFTKNLQLIYLEDINFSYHFNRDRKLDLMLNVSEGIRL